MTDNKVFCVAGIDTDIGKTIVTGMLAKLSLYEKLTLHIEKAVHFELSQIYNQTVSLILFQKPWCICT